MSTDPSWFFNRELSWLDFNQRVLELAEDESVPLLERVKFCAIYASNLDEFFMVRVAGLWDQVDAGIDARGPDGLSPREQIQAIRSRSLELDRRLTGVFDQVLRPELAEKGIKVARLRRSQRNPNASRARPEIRSPGLPDPDPPGDRARSSIPVHLQPLAHASPCCCGIRRLRPGCSPGSRCPRNCSAASSN